MALIVSRARPQLLNRRLFEEIVGDDGDLLAGSGDGDVTEAGVEQVRVDASVGVEEVDVPEFTR